MKSPRACHEKEREKTSPTVPLDFIGPARNPLNGPDQPKQAITPIKPKVNITKSVNLRDVTSCTLMRQTHLMDINIDALYNILKQNQGDVNDALGYKKKAVVITSDPLALVAEKTKVSKQKEKVVVSLDSEGSGADDFSELKKITALTLNVKDYNYYKTKMLLAKKDSDEQVLLAEDQAWMESKKIIIDLEDEIMTLLEKEKANLKTIESLKSKGFESCENAIFETENQSENDCQVVEKECDKVENPKVIAPGMFKLSVSQSVSPISMSNTSCDYENVENLDTFSSVRRPKHSDVIWKKKGSSNTSNVDLSYVTLLKLNKNVKMCDLFDENNLFIFDDESVRISPVSKMPFRKKPHDSMNIVQICLWIIDSGCSKHMTGNRALLTNFVEMFLGTVCFGNNDFAVIAGHEDVVIGSMTINKEKESKEHGSEENDSIASNYESKEL
nr:integrase, catalytic region, zinc finger, CCHC-type, peptidase aspartic, catalytic [Tanacetum cinerariifolium]